MVTELPSFKVSRTKYCAVFKLSVRYLMLGFDTAEQSYIWLVTSILRDSRLERVPYQGADVPDNE